MDRSTPRLSEKSTDNIYGFFFVVILTTVIFGSVTTLAVLIDESASAGLFVFLIAATITATSVWVVSATSRFSRRFDAICLRCNKRVMSLTDHEHVVENTKQFFKEVKNLRDGVK